MREKARRPRLEACTHVPWNKDTEAAKFTRSVVERLSVENTLCATVLQPDDYQLLLVEAPDVEPTELRAAVRWRIKDLISFHIDDAVIDVFEIPGQSRPGQPRMMYTVAARASVIQRRVEWLENSGVQLEIIDIPEMALRNIAALLPEDADGTATLCLTEDFGLIVLTRQHTLYLTRRLDIGTRALAEAAAETAGEVLDGSTLERLLGNIVLELQRSLDYYESHYTQAPIGTVMLTPTAEPLPYLSSYLSQNLGTRVGDIDLTQLVDDINGMLDRQTQAECLLAIGTALRVEGYAL